MDDGNVIGAFSEEYASRLTGISRSQLRYWHEIGFLIASYAAEEPGRPYGRVYSFRDLVALRVLNELRNVHHVSRQELQRVSERLKGDQDDRWIKRTLWVHERRVVWEDPAVHKKQEVVSGQYLFNIIPLRVVASSVRQRISELNRRSSDQLGQVVRRRFVAQNRPVIAGTRVPIAAIRDFREAGYTIARIRAEYPSLTVADVKAALAYPTDNAAA